MTTFRPCIGCTARKDCEIKKGAVKALRGVPITSAKIKCSLPFTEHFPPGTRVKVMVWDARDERVSSSQYDYDSRLPAKMVSATVVGPSSKKAGKLLCHLDAPVMSERDTEIEFRAAWPKEVERLDEPRAPFCKSCSRAIVKGECSCPPAMDDY
jgi:hypothetical protein